MWEHAPSMDMPLSEDALQFARKLAASKYTYPDDRLAVADLLGAVEPRAGLVGGRAPHGVAAVPGRRRCSTQAQTQDEVSHIAVGGAGVGDGRRPPPTTMNRSTRTNRPEAGDDDAEDELDAIDADDFYADALEDA